ncbi:MAG: TetR/AcrR family transcriptional regulator [Acidimicrobiia bacterium]
MPVSSSQTRDQLIRATRDAIRDVGLPAVTARVIAERSGANLASIPYHFGSKDALVAEALVAEARELVAPVLALLAADRPPPERASEAASLLSELFDASRSQVPVYLAALAAAPHAPGVRAGLAELWTDLRSRLAHDIRRQLDARQLPGWVSPDAMASLILSVVNGVVVASVVDPEGPDHREVAAQFLALLLAAGGLPERHQPATDVRDHGDPG